MFYIYRQQKQKPSENGNYPQERYTVIRLGLYKLCCRANRRDEGWNPSQQRYDKK